VQLFQVKKALSRIFSQPLHVSYQFFEILFGMSTWLKDINILELSPVKRPANRKRAIVRKSTEESMIIKDLSARLEKAELDEAQKQAVMAALDALEMAREGMDPEAFEAAMGALASLMMPEAPEEEPMDVDAEDGPEADMADGEEEEKACDDMEKEDEMKKSEDFEALLKARDDELAELRKSLADRDEAIKAKSYQEKAESFSGVPLATDELAALLRVVDDAGKEDVAKSLERLLSGTSEVIGKSEAFQELGGSGEATEGKDGAMGKIDALAEAVIQKSAQKITREQAVARVLDENPELYTEWVNQG
jgi:hypothetical protein